MAQEELEITIGVDGKVQVRTIGIKGTRCLDVAEMLARVIGREESRELTSEYYESATGIENKIHMRQRLE